MLSSGDIYASVSNGFSPKTLISYTIDLAATWEHMDFKH